MWMEAKRQWQVHVALPTPSPPTPTTTTITTTSSSTADEKPPKHFSAWAQCVETYNAKLLDGKRRKFPTHMLVGAEEELARLYHEHEEQAVHALGLGEILSRRTFAPDKSMNPLAQRRAANAASGVQTLRLDSGELVASSEKEWTPKSMMAITDEADAAKWALILVGIGAEMVGYPDVLNLKDGFENGFDMIGEYGLAITRRQPLQQPHHCGQAAVVHRWDDTTRRRHARGTHGRDKAGPSHRARQGTRVVANYHHAHPGRPRHGHPVEAPPGDVFAATSFAIL